MKRVFFLTMALLCAVSLLAGCARIRESLSVFQSDNPAATQDFDFPDISAPEVSMPEVSMPEVVVPTDLPATAPTAPPKPDTNEILLSAMKDEIPVTLENGQEVRICSYLQSNHGAVPISFAFVDFEGDEECELIIQSRSDSAAYAILRYNESGIRAYLFPTRSLWDMKRDGTFRYEEVLGYTIINRMNFYENTYSIYRVATANWTKNIYEITSVPCTRDEFTAYENERRGQEPIDWILISEA